MKRAKPLKKKARKKAVQQEKTKGTEKRKKENSVSSVGSCSQARGLNSRQEKFCGLYVEGRTAAEAYRVAYGRGGHTAEANGSRLLRNAEVRARIAALRSVVAAGTVLSLRAKREYLYRVVTNPVGHVDQFSDLCQEYTRREEGGDRGRLKRGQADRGNEEHEPEYEVIKIKMPDKLRAIELDAKLAGELTNEVKVEAGDGLTELLAAIRGG